MRHLFVKCLTSLVLIFKTKLQICFKTVLNLTFYDYHIGYFEICRNKHESPEIEKKGSVSRLFSWVHVGPIRPIYCCIYTIHRIFDGDIG